MNELWEAFAGAPRSVWQISHLELTVRLILSIGLGGIIGLEREWNNHSAGLRTHILVCAGSTVIMLLSIYGFSSFVLEPNVRIDPARLAAQVISGIGFLGAGAILRNGLTVSGLTTAASIWVVAAIGLCIGAGFYFASILCTILVFFVLQVLNRWEKRMKRMRGDGEIVISVFQGPGTIAKISNEFRDQDIHVHHVKIVAGQPSAPNGAPRKPAQLVYRIRTGNVDKLLDALERIRGLEGIESVELHTHVRKPQTNGAGFDDAAALGPP